MFKAQVQESIKLFFAVGAAPALQWLTACLLRGEKRFYLPYPLLIQQMVLSNAQVQDCSLVLGFGPCIGVIDIRTLNSWNEGEKMLQGPI